MSRTSLASPSGANRARRHVSDNEIQGLFTSGRFREVDGKVGMLKLRTQWLGDRIKGDDPAAEGPSTPSDALNDLPDRNTAAVAHRHR